MNKLKANYSVAVLGCGQMAKALLMGMKSSKMTFYCYTPTGTRARALAQLLEAKDSDCEASAVECLEDLPPCDLYIIGVKPQQFDQLVRDLKKAKIKVDPTAVVLSMMAALDCKMIGQKLNHQKVMRVMPNTPVSLGLGVLLFYASKALVRQDVYYILDLYRSCGELFLLEKEEELEIMTPYSGSGPAFVFESARIMIELLKEQGVGDHEARRLVAQTFEGASAMLKKSPLTAKELREQVTSAKGVTQRALEVFEKAGLFELYKLAIHSAQDRARQLINEIKMANQGEDHE